MICFLKKFVSNLLRRVMVSNIYQKCTFLINNFTMKSPHEINRERWLVSRHSTGGYSIKSLCYEVQKFQSKISVSPSGEAWEWCPFPIPSNFLKTLPIKTDSPLKKSHAYLIFQINIEIKYTLECHTSLIWMQMILLFQLLLVFYISQL